jgi:hypothetical protein
MGHINRCGIYNFDLKEEGHITESIKIIKKHYNHLIRKIEKRGYKYE